MSTCIQEVHDACTCEIETSLAWIERVTDEVYREYYGSETVNENRSEG